MNNKMSLHLSSVLCLVLLCASSNVIVSEAKNPFVDISYKAAGVLPIYWHKGTKFVAVAREDSGTDRGTYDAFAGARDQGEHNPTLTAARECAEELVTHRTMGKGVSKMQAYIDVNHKNTELVIAHSRKHYVLFVVRFDHYIDRIKHTFYKAVKNPNLDRKYREKDKLAFVPWQEFKEAIKNNNAVVTAMVQEEDPKTHKLILQQQTIRLRPILVSVMRPYFNHEQYQTGSHQKIRLY
jgi:8-oxo-dGTP pyrophosphatase MutT (NUDIX family)